MKIERSGRAKLWADDLLREGNELVHRRMVDERDIKKEICLCYVVVECKIERLNANV